MSGFGEGRFGEGRFGEDGSVPSPPPVPDPNPVWQLLGVNPDQSIDRQIEYSTLTLVPRHLALGSWSLAAGFDGNVDSPIGRLLRPGAGIVAIANGTPVFSGPVTKTDRTREGDAHTITIGGTDDLQVIADRQAHQDPTHADTLAFDGSFALAQDDQSGHAAETAIKHWVRVNAGPDAILTRRVLNLTVEPDGARGLANAWPAARMQNLLDLIVQVATSANLGVRVLRVDATNRQFQVYAPEDKRASVVFSVELGNVQSYQYGSERPSGNVEYIGGKGGGADRAFQIVQDATSLGAWGRIEKFNDQASQDTLAKLAVAGQTDLLAAAAKFSLSATTIDTQAHVWAPLVKKSTQTPWNVGDMVTVVVDGIEVAEVIREATITHSKDGTTVIPTIGTAGPAEKSLFSTLAARIRTLEARISEQERR